MDTKKMGFVKRCFSLQNWKPLLIINILSYVFYPHKLKCGQCF